MLGPSQMCLWSPADDLAVCAGVRAAPQDTTFRVPTDDLAASEVHPVMVTLIGVYVMPLALQLSDCLIRKALFQVYAASSTQPGMLTRQSTAPEPGHDI